MNLKNLSRALSMPSIVLNALHPLLHLALVSHPEGGTLVLRPDKEAKAQTPNKWQSQNIS